MLPLTGKPLFHGDRKPPQRTTWLSPANKREIRLARSRMFEARAAGKLVSPEECSVCRTTDARIESHILDYRNPLDVVWVCHRCGEPLRQAKLAEYKAAARAGGGVVAGLSIRAIDEQEGNRLRRSGETGRNQVPEEYRLVKGPGEWKDNHGIYRDSAERHMLLRIAIDADFDRYVAGQPSHVGDILNLRGKLLIDRSQSSQASSGTARLPVPAPEEPEEIRPARPVLTAAELDAKAEKVRQSMARVQAQAVAGVGALMVVAEAGPDAFDPEAVGAL